MRDFTLRNGGEFSRTVGL